MYSNPHTPSDAQIPPMVTKVEQSNIVLLLEERLALPGVRNWLMFLPRQETPGDDQPWFMNWLPLKTSPLLKRVLPDLNVQMKPLSQLESHGYNKLLIHV